LNNEAANLMLTVSQLLRYFIFLIRIDPNHELIQIENGIIVMLPYWARGVFAA
jgi:hypothetical protein